MADEKKGVKPEAAPVTEVIPEPESKQAPNVPPPAADTQLDPPTREELALLIGEEIKNLEAAEAALAARRTEVIDALIRKLNNTPETKHADA